MKEKNWYCSSYDVIKTNDGSEVFPDCDFFTANSNEEAIEIAKQRASEGIDYVDIGHFELDLISVTRVDSENEWDDIETIWY